MITAILVIALVAMAGYVFVYLPNRWRVPLHEALRLMQSDDRDDLSRADRLLGQALTAGIRGRPLADARFAQAFVRARLGRYDPSLYGAAASVLADLVAAAGYDEDTVFLDLWLHSRMDQHDRVLDLYQKHTAALRTNEAAKKIVAVSAMRKAVEHWRRREVEGALHYFDQVRELDELTEHIPAHVNDLQLVNGVQAVFDGRTQDAQRSFADAKERAGKRNASTAQAELGLIVCAWELGAWTQIDADLGRVLERLDGPELNGDEEAGPLRAHGALLHVLTLLHRWKDEPPAQGQLPEHAWNELERRVERVLAADPELGDALLVWGLLRYYFAAGAVDRDAAIAELEASVALAKGVRVPEVLQLIEQERWIGDEKGAIARYLDLLAEHLADPEVSERQRRELTRLRENLSTFLDPAEVAQDVHPHEQLTLQDQRNRSALLGRRMRAIVFARTRDRPDDPQVARINALAKERETAVGEFAKGVEGLQHAEHSLIAETGEFLLTEENHG